MKRTCIIGVLFIAATMTTGMLADTGGTYPEMASICPIPFLLLMQLSCYVDQAVAVHSITVPALGRPFSLGDLYDLKADTIVMGPTLWNTDHLANYTERIQRTTKFEVSASQQINDVKNLFDIDARLSLSFMGGLVKVSGSAGYLDDRVKISNIARVSLQFSTRTFTRKLKPEMFTKVDFAHVLEKVPSATHVVSAIEYGASAVFVFDRKVSTYETKREVKGSMEASIKSIPGFQMEGGASVKMTEEEKKNVDKFTCKFHGDFVLKEHPGTYMEAIKVYKELPSYLGKNYENSVPMKIWLYPLDALPISKESEVLYDIKDSLVHEITTKFEELNKMEVMSNDILDSIAAQYSERIQNKVEEFKSYIHLFTLRLKQQIAKLLPQIRANGKESSLSKVLEDKERSPFANVHLDEWIANVKKEIIVLETTHRLPNYCHHEADFSALLLNNKKYTFALTLRLDGSTDTFIEEMAKYMDDAKNMADYGSIIETKHKWFADHELISNLQRKGSSFASFSDIEKAKTERDILKSDIQFLVREKIITEGEQRGVTIEMFEYANLIDADYEIPSETGTPEAKITSHDRITISWDEPRDGVKNIHHYEIETFILEVDETNGQNQSDSGFKKLTPFQTKGKVNMMEIPGLKPEKTYMFIVSTYSEQGKTAESKQSEFIRTLACPKGMYHHKEQCFPCNPGYFSDIIGALSCEKCPIGFYSDSHGNKKCQSCPIGTVTVQPGAKSESECGGDMVHKFKNILKKIERSRNERIDRLNASVLIQSKNVVHNVDNILKTFEMRVNERINRLDPFILIQYKNFKNATANHMFANGLWAHYKRGFGSKGSDAYWAGLEQIHAMTRNGGYNLMFEFIWDQNEDGSTDPLAGSKARVEFKDFRVTSESDGYKLKVGKMIRQENIRESRETVNAVLQYSFDWRFLTRDRDTEGALGHCSDGGGGWWLDFCASYCLNCKRYVIFDGGKYRIPATTSMWLRRVY